MARLLVLGAGGYGRAVAEVALSLGEYTVVGFVDDRWPEIPPVWGLPVLGRMADLPQLALLADAAVPAIGDNAARQAACHQAMAAGLALASVIHPRAVVAPSAVLGQGVTVMAAAVIGTEARIDEGAVINAAVVVDHQAQVGACAYLGVGACMGGGSTLAAGQRLLAGNTLAPAQHLSLCQPGTPQAL